MLPTKGYFQDIECPFYENSCNRPYCHFRHRKKCQESSEDVSGGESSTEQPEVPTYKPTPKSELAAQIKSHIPISYVPDLAFVPARSQRPVPKFNFEKPTYKPTPLSILSSANKPGTEQEDGSEHSKAIKEIQQNKINSEYNPEVSLKTDIDFDNLSAEIDLIDDLIDSSITDEKSSDALENSEQKNSSENGVKSKSEKSSKSSSGSRSKSHSSRSSHSSKSKHHKSDTKDRHRDKDKKESKSRHKSSKNKSRDKERHSSSSKHKSSHHRDKPKEKSKDKKKECEEEKHKKSKDSESDQDLDIAQDNNISETEYADLDDEIEEEDTLLECYKIFNEYKPPEKQEQPIIKENEEKPLETEEEIAFGKKRIAHATSSGAEAGSKIQHIKPKIIQSAAQVMQNRFKLAREAQANNEAKNIQLEVKEALKRPAPSLLEAAKSLKLQKLSRASNTNKEPTSSCNVIDSIINGSKNKPKKIAPVMNVSLIQREKARVEELAKKTATAVINKTIAQTVKGAKRVAHVPDLSLSDIPDVLNADKSKLPINVRTRFLTMIADECVKLYLIKEDAYNRALNEEFACYEKCKVLATYRNSAMLAVNRLRKELQEREKLNLGPIGSGEELNKGKSSDFTGKKFYNHVKQYVLTDEELDIHGYPKESSIPGRAVIKNRIGNKPLYSLPENQRKCARCGKIYLVDDDGFALYNEECIYHPLKKRTLRGEQSYLCCKSNDSTGCATANTHVCDLPEEAELEGFQTTMPPERDDDPRSFQVYALDCEMCYTTKGLELTRVTIVDSDCKTVYESLVKPWNPIIDYNTTFSGITKEQMERTSTSILQVQANILHLCNSQTILIGHSLESDMKALKIIHGSIIDTSVLFPHKMGLPHKRALRMLASEFLKKIIQNSVSGHDSAEDAIACMELVKWKVKEELKVKGGK